MPPVLQRILRLPFTSNNQVRGVFAVLGAVGVGASQLIRGFQGLGNAQAPTRTMPVPLNMITAFQWFGGLLLNSCPANENKALYLGRVTWSFIKSIITTPLPASGPVNPTDFPHIMIAEMKVHQILGCNSNTRGANQMKKVIVLHENYFLYIGLFFKVAQIVIVTLISYYLIIRTIRFMYWLINIKGVTVTTSERRPAIDVSATLIRKPPFID